jgi:Pentapeptide repeats (8 copies)
MANVEHLARLTQGVAAWNQWRAEDSEIRPDLAGAHLVGADLSGANLTQANLSGANLAGASLARACLEGARLVATNFEGANLTACQVYGISVWDVNLVEAQQFDIVITYSGEPEITVDNLEVAQFIYLLLHNEKIREVIDTITSKAVLILGRFTPERKVVLDAIREELRKRGRLPILFDFTPPTGQTLLETVSTLAHMARFIIADLTDAKSILQELTAIVPYSPTLVVQPIILASQEEPGMWDFFRRLPWVLEPYRYHSLDEVRASLEDKIIAPAELKANELLGLVKR